MCNFCCTFDILPHNLLGILCFGSEGLPKLARRTYSEYLPPATIRCGLIASCSRPAGHTVPHFRNLFCKWTAPSISPCMRASLCKHKRPLTRQNIEYILYFCKKGSENLRMCNFCCTFAG